MARNDGGIRVISVDRATRSQHEPPVGDCVRGIIMPIDEDGDR
jgi:hypothetical protein